MRSAKLSMWNNKWSEVFDFTAGKGSDEVHYTIKNQLQSFFIPSYDRVRTLFDTVNIDRKALGVESTNLIKDLNEDELESLSKEVELETTQDISDDDAYFLKLAPKILIGLLPSRTAQNRARHSDASLLVVGCNSSDAIFD